MTSPMRIITPTATFGLNLLRAERRRNPGKNVDISPLSVSLGLGMTYNGARAITAAEMANVLGINPIKRGRANAGYAQLLDRLAEDLGVELAIANGIYADESSHFHSEFLETNESIFKAQVERKNFGQSRTLDDINDFVFTKTKKKIKKILEDLDPAAIMVLVNALYFKGDWSRKFDKNLTDLLPFLAPGGSNKHPTMFGQWEMAYTQTDMAQVVQLPFGQKQRVRLLAVLPTDGHSLDDVLAGLTGESLTDISTALVSREVKLWLPRHEGEYKSNLNDSLAEIGMPTAFGGGADFSGMRNIPPVVKIGRVQHATLFRMDEDGAELAAATAVEQVEECCFMPAPPVEMRVDRPFIKLIVDSETGALISAGVIVNPEWTEAEKDGKDSGEPPMPGPDNPCLIGSGDVNYELVSGHEIAEVHTGGEPEVMITGGEPIEE